MILYISHVLEVVERVCARVLILYRGKIITDDSVENLRKLANLLFPGGDFHATCGAA